MGNQQGLTRRQFVQAGSVAAAAAVVPGCTGLPSSKASGLGSGPIRIGLFGFRTPRNPAVRGYLSARQRGGVVRHERHPRLVSSNLGCEGVQRGDM